MRILQLQASNIKRLTVVSIDANPNVVRITGANGHGKSSVIDSIFYALAGSRGHPSQPIRHGEQRADIRLDLGELIVRRRFTPSGTSLDVENRDGMVFKRPQDVLDRLIGTMTFDPLAFARQSAKQQVEQLRGIVHVDADLDALDATSKAAYDERREINRRVDSLKERVATLEAEVDPKADTEPVDVSVLLDQMQQASAHNAALSREQAARETSERRRDELKARMSSITQQLMVLQEEFYRISSEVLSLDSADRIKPALAAPVDTTDIRRQIDAAHQANARRDIQRRAQELHREAVNDLQAAMLESENLTNTITDCQATKQDAIARAQMPVTGLSFGEGVVTYNHVPLDQASSAEQIRVATAIGMALNPKLRILCIRDGSLLDENSMRMLEQMAESHDFQVWIECVDTSGTVGISMVDGAVASIDGDPVSVEVLEDEAAA